MRYGRSFSACSTSSLLFVLGLMNRPRQYKESFQIQMLPKFVAQVEFEKQKSTTRIHRSEHFPRVIAYVVLRGLTKSSWNSISILHWNLDLYSLKTSRNCRELLVSLSSYV